MSNKEELIQEAKTFEEGDSEQPIPPPDIVAYNELRSCADLVRMHASGKLELQPDFQRDIVWKQDDQSRFIDSLVKQLPIPSMCFSLDYKTQRWKVIDGLQRMSSIVKFLSPTDWRLSNLPDIHSSLRSMRNSDLRQGNDEQMRLYTRVEDVSIPVTVIRCDYTQRSHMLYLFTIFHRLNSGGVRLTNQEIRNCIYSGPFNDEIKSFDHGDQNWRVVKRLIWGSMDRFRSVEVLLRVLAFGDRRAQYDGNLAKFLNSYMHDKTEAPGVVGELGEVLANIAARAKAVLAAAGQRTKLPLLVMEALLVALYSDRDNLAGRTDADLVDAYKAMLAHPSFAESARYAVSSVSNVTQRLDAAVNAFMPK
ncbi:DUF262 domain-containing protein [Ralstonia pseudosolanacearum]|uniref:DUF262 domain-containing protein n=2 Tax=Ralstonia pseudosolanacearum TaxID=1310165 RepID=UPI0009BEF09D|nr:MULTISPECIES: DUF262 domain-containing protein [Ralstonia]QKL51885.1 DUF262 domain-containing protein [Ralstonia solanacearum]QKM23140.1 DUF262 domain-containing protein [Ralstonia solanacearum]QKM27948.1 DUF262 domain-containing protein [Ralstonia solanacearum]UZF33539.1 DUF262 domain-containing protein [Ralstonia sp. RS647]BCM07219.1 hypothetical protein MAFF241647_15760 [Ralstonia solanacearum]